MSGGANPPHQTTPENGVADAPAIVADGHQRAKDGWSKAFLLISAVIAATFLLQFWGRDGGWGMPIVLAFPVFVAFGIGILVFAAIRHRPKLAASVLSGFALIASDIYTHPFTTVALERLWLHLNKSQFDAKIAEARSKAKGNPVRVELHEKDLAMWVTDEGHWMLMIYDETDQLVSDPDSVNEIIKWPEHPKDFATAVHIIGHYYRVYVDS